MNSLAYTVSPILAETLTSIDQLRTAILLTPIPPHLEARLRWRTTRLPELDERQRMTFGSLRNDWSAQGKTFSMRTLEAIVETMFPKLKRSLLRTMREEEQEWKRFFAYLSAQKDHPVIQSGLLYATASESKLASVRSFPPLITLLSLATTWYDCRGTLPLPSPTERAGSILERYGQLTVWLEAFTREMAATYEALSQTMNAARTEPMPTAWNLPNRHKRILSLFENPKATVTNRDIQRLFHVSQVTASRDLAHLAALGLLYSHGKGRSVYYTKL